MGEIGSKSKSYPIGTKFGNCILGWIRPVLGNFKLLKMGKKRFWIWIEFGNNVKTAIRG